MASYGVTTPNEVPKSISISRQGVAFNYQVNVEKLVAPVLANVPPALKGFGESALGKLIAKLPNIVINAKLNWVHVASAATYGHQGYRLGQRTSHAVRHDGSLWDQIGDHVESRDE